MNKIVLMINLHLSIKKKKKKKRQRCGNYQKKKLMYHNDTLLWQKGKKKTL